MKNMHVFWLFSLMNDPAFVWFVVKTIFSLPTMAQNRFVLFYYTMDKNESLTSSDRSEMKPRSACLSVCMSEFAGWRGCLYVLMFTPLIHGTAAVCSEACISMGLEEEGVSQCVCVCVCVYTDWRHRRPLISILSACAERIDPHLHPALLPLHTSISLFAFSHHPTPPTPPLPHLPVLSLPLLLTLPLPIHSFLYIPSPCRVQPASQINKSVEHKQFKTARQQHPLRAAY